MMPTDGLSVPTTDCLPPNGKIWFWLLKPETKFWHINGTDSTYCYCRVNDSPTCIITNQRQQSNSSRTITNSLAPANAGKPGRTEPQHPGTSHGNDANAEPEYATAPRCSAQEYDDYRRTATTEIRHDGPPAGSITEIHRETTGWHAPDGGRKAPENPEWTYRSIIRNRPFATWERAKRTGRNEISCSRCRRTKKGIEQRKDERNVRRSPTGCTLRTNDESRTVRRQCQNQKERNRICRICYQTSGKRWRQQHRLPPHRRQISERYIRTILWRIRSGRRSIDGIVRQTIGKYNQKDGKRHPW